MTNVTEKTNGLSANTLIKKVQGFMNNYWYEAHFNQSLKEVVVIEVAASIDSDGDVSREDVNYVTSFKTVGQFINSIFA